MGARAVGRIARSAGPPGIDRYRDQERSTKAGQARRFSIEPELLPLLRVMHDDAGRKGRVVVHMPEGTILSRRLREHLERAGVARPDLFANDRTRKQLTFYDLRATGITWMAVRGTTRSGSRAGAATCRSRRQSATSASAEQVRDGSGEVFPALPTELVLSLDQSSSEATRSR
ncbi:MAG TPA: hypothetical protein VL242_14230 [Sorangium sp.]|nr:hypothetical protein [Sorangium sp.]